MPGLDLDRCAHLHDPGRVVLDPLPPVQVADPVRLTHAVVRGQVAHQPPVDHAHRGRRLGVEIGVDRARIGGGTGGQVQHEQSGVDGRAEPAPGVDPVQRGVRHRHLLLGAPGEYRPGHLRLAQQRDCHIALRLELPD